MDGNFNQQSYQYHPPHHNHSRSVDYNKPSTINIFSDINKYNNDLFRAQANSHKLELIRDSVASEYHRNIQKISQYRLALKEDDMDYLDLEIQRQENEKVLQNFLNEKKRLEYEKDLEMMRYAEDRHQDDLRSLEKGFSDIERITKLFVKTDLAQNDSNLILIFRF